MSFKVRIVKASKEGYWYKRHIGKVFEVQYYHPGLDFYHLSVPTDSMSFGRRIQKSDCVPAHYNVVRVPVRVCYESQNES